MDQTENTWRGKLTCFSPNYIEHEVSGQTLHFYPVSLGMAFKLRTIGRPLAKALAILFAGQHNDHGTKDVTVANEHGSHDREITIEAVPESMAKFRGEQRAEAIDGLIASLTDDANAAVVGEIIMDSLREVFPAGNRDNPPAQEFISTMPLPALGNMLAGLAKANKDVFGPLTDQVVAAASAAMDRLGAAGKDAEEPVVDVLAPPPVVVETSEAPTTSG